MITMAVVLALALYGLIRVGFGHPHHAPQPASRHQPHSQPSALPPGAITVKQDKLMGVSTVTPVTDRMQAFATAVGRQPDVVEYYLPFAKRPFPGTTAYELGKQNILSLIQLDPRKISLHAIARGKFDTYLHEFAGQVHQFGGRVALSFGHEMNGWWYSWCIPVKHTQAQVTTVPANFVAAWRHIHDVFQAEHASNVTWVWTISRNTQRLGWPPLSAWWPGSKYVDWIGMDGYFRQAGETFSDLFDAQLAVVGQITKKPLLITETAVSGANADYASQVKQIFAGVTDPANHMLGFIWFDIDADAHWNIDHVKALDTTVSKEISDYRYH